MPKSCLAKLYAALDLKNQLCYKIFQPNMCNARVLASNKSPAKSHVFSKTFHWARSFQENPDLKLFSLLSSARTPRIPPAPPIPHATTRATTAHHVMSPSAATAPWSATSPGIPGLPRSRQPTRFIADTTSAPRVLEPGESPTKNPFPLS
jgi:hypothetical protein